MRKRIYKALAVFFWRLAAKPLLKAPDGLPGIRDAFNRCNCFEPRKRKIGDFRDCHGDGHYLCKECCHLMPEGCEE